MKFIENSWCGLMIVFYIFFIWILLRYLQTLLRGNVSKEIKIQDLSNQIFCITGGNRGIGLEVVKILLRWNGIVILGVRNVELCKSTLHPLLTESERDRLIISHLDLSSFYSVHEFVRINFIKPKRKLNCLINNAHHSGLAKLISTEDSIEYSYQVNYLSHCLLTILLIPFLNSDNISSPSRIVHVGSRTHRYGKIRKERYDVKSRGHYSYDPNQIYPDTKFMQLLFSHSLTEYLHKHDYNISSNYVHPGGLVQTTDNWVRGPEYSFAMRLEPLLMKFAGTNVGDAAKAVVKLATQTPEIVEYTDEFNKARKIVLGGKYFDTTEEKEICIDEQFKVDASWLWKTTFEIIDIPLNSLS